MSKRILTLVLALAMAAALCGCGGGKPEQSPDTTESGSGIPAAEAEASDRPAEGGESAEETGRPLEGGEITVGISADLDSSLDPHTASSAAGTREVLFNIYEGLVKPDTDGNLIPAIAESYVPGESADEYSFTLREGVRFHNGQPVTVGDIVYSVSRAAGLETGEPLVASLANVAAVEAVDEKTVVIRLKQPDTEFLAYCTVAIIPEGSDPADGIIGTGPFMFVSRRAQEGVVIEKFEDYWGEKAHLDRVTFKVIEDGETLVMSLRSGAVDLANHLEAGQVASLSGLTILEGSMNIVQALYLNNAAEPFNDPRVREALCWAIDKQAVIDLAADGHGFALGSSMYPAFARYFDESLTDYYTQDIEKARALLAEAGYENGLSFTITVASNHTPHVNTAQVIAYQLEQIGVTANIELVDWSTWYDEVYKGRNFEATITGMDASSLSASALLARFESTSSKNFIGFENEDYDAAYAAAVACTDEQEQTELFRECQRILTENAANVYIQDVAEFVAMQPDVGGYEFYPMYLMDLAKVYKIG